MNTLLNDKNYVALTYITGILPIKEKKENQLFLNNFDELFMIQPGWRFVYIGFINAEMEEFFYKTKRNNSTTKANKNTEKN